MGCATSSSQMDNVVPPSSNLIEPQPLKPVVNDLPEVQSNVLIENVPPSE